MDSFKKERAIIRRIFTIKIKIINDGLEAEDSDTKELTTTMKVLSIKVVRLFQLDELILQGLINDGTLNDDELYAETEQTDVYRHQWVKLQNEFKIRRNDEVSSNNSDNGKSLHSFNNLNKRHFTLPKLELIKFDGDVKNWIAFWGQFQKIHNDDSLDNHDKFQYLLQATVKGSKARSLIDSFPPSGDNYLIAMEHLKERFARDDLIVEVYVRELLSLFKTQIKENHQLSLDVLYDKLNTQIRALETLGVTTDKYAAIMYPIVESTLSEEILKVWQRSQAGSITKDAGTNLNNLLLFLKYEVESNQRIALARSGFSNDNIKSSSVDSTLEAPQFTASCLVTKNKIDTKLCVWCDKLNHSSLECFKISKLTLDERIKFLKNKKACLVCLKIGHSTYVCKAYIKCIACYKKHNVILCPDLSSIKKNNDNAIQNSSQQNTEMSLSHHNNITLLQTLLIKISYLDKQIIVRALIDNGAQRSYIKRELAQKLSLPYISEESMSHIVFGGSETTKQKHRLYNIIITNINDTFQFTMNVLDEDKICGALPRVNDSNFINNLSKHNIILTDVGHDIPVIGILIGADYSGMLLTPNIVQLENGLTAICTKLGWTIQGQKSGIFNSITTLISQNNNNITDLSDSEFIGIRDPAETKSNRVNEIRSFSNVVDWYHVPGNKNPADLLSRGCNPKTLVSSSWWEGPSWLRINKLLWPINVYNEDVMAKIEFKSAVNIVNNSIKFSNKILIYFSKFSKIVTMTAWIIRFINNCRLKKNKKQLLINKTITSNEYIFAEKKKWLLVQYEIFNNVNKNNIHGITYYKDDVSLLRVKTKLTLSDENNSFKYPILLPFHKEIRGDYWVLRIRRLAKNIVNKCVICKRFNSIKYESPFSPLPYNRVNRFVGVFEVCGIDLAGPLYLRSNVKCHIVLFTCAVYRAVHLELFESLSTESYLMAMRRFIARRGRVSTIYSDNGSNFVGTNNLFDSLNWNKIQDEANINKIKWIFNPPTAAWWGGWWERLIRTIKYLLKRVLGKTVVTYVELETILCYCEAIINSRPLSYISSDSSELTPISPNSFLQTIPHNNVNDIDKIDTNALNRRLQYVQKLREDLRHRFRIEYLGLLVHRGKEKSSVINIGDVVLIETDKKRVEWPLGVVKELYPGTDGFSRVAKIKTSTGEKVRPIQRLYPLEISNYENAEFRRINKDINIKAKEHEVEEVQAPEYKTRSGRVVKVPQRLV